MKMAGVVATAMLAQNQAQGLVLPSGAIFTAKWLEEVRLTEAPVIFYMDTYYSCCGDNGDAYYGYGSSYSLGIGVEQQANDYWCWITVALSIANYYGHGNGWNQCDLYDAIMRQRHSWYAGWGSCCPAPVTNDPCHETGAVATALDFCGITYSSEINHAINFQDVAREIIEYGRPVVIHFSPSGARGVYHFEAITGVSCMQDNGVDVGTYDIAETNGQTSIGVDSRLMDQHILDSKWDSTLIGIQPVSEA